MTDVKMIVDDSALRSYVPPSRGALFADVQARTVRGMLMPYGEESRLSMSQTEPLSFEKGTLKLPRDPRALNANIEHNRYMPAARFESLEDTDSGVVASFTVSNTDEGDELLDGIQSGRLTRLSAEVRELVRRGSKAVSAVLTGAAFVGEGAFASAALFAIGDVIEEAPAEIEPTDPAHLVLAAESAPEDITVTLPDGDPAVYTPAPTPAEESETEGEFAIMTSIVPDGVVTPEAPAAPTVDTSASALFAALAHARTTGDKRPLAKLSDTDGGDLFAAYAPLSDITATAAAGTFPPQFLGEVYRKDAFVQSVLPLFLHDDLKALTVTGWAWNARPTVGTYAGDKAAIPTNVPTFAAVNTVAERIAGGHDVDRALRDFGNEDFWSSYFRIMVEEYKKLADARVLAKISTAAPVVTPSTLVAGQDAGTAALIDGALSIIAAGYSPTFAIVSREIFRTFLMTPKDKVLEYLSSAFAIGPSEGPGASGGSGSLGGFRIVPNATLAAKRVIVGSKQAATVYELPGAAPIRVEGLDVAHAGIDPAVYGYVATLVNDAAALASVTTL